jgi:hypothetical protein
MMEQKDFDGCIATCKKGIEMGRAAKVDYKVIAKSFLRIGNAYKKQGKLEEAIRAYEDSLMEDRSEEAEKMLKQTRVLKKQVTLRLPSMDTSHVGVCVAATSLSSSPHVPRLCLTALQPQRFALPPPLCRPTRTRTCLRRRPRRRAKRGTNFSRKESTPRRSRCTPKP